MKITKSVFVFIPVIVAILFIVFFVVDDAIAEDGSPTGYWTDKDGNNYYGDPPSSSGTRDYTPNIPQGPSPQELERQRKQQLCVQANDRGVVFHNSKDYNNAIKCYEEALRHNPNNQVTIDNLNAARGDKVNNVGITYFDKRNWLMAIRYFREALGYNENEAYKNNLRIAEEQLELENKEGIRKERECIQKEQIAEAKGKITAILADLSADINTSSSGELKDSLSSASEGASGNTPGGLDFMAPSASGSKFSKGTKDSAPVKLAFIDPRKDKVVDPRVIKGKMSPEEARKERELDLKVKTCLVLAEANLGQNRYEDAIKIMKKAVELKPDDMNLRKNLGLVYYLRDKQKGLAAPSPKAKALLDAFKLGDGEWDYTIQYLQLSHRMRPDDLGIRDAYNFASGLRKGMEGGFGSSGVIMLPTPDSIPDQTTRGLVNKGIVAMGDDSESAYCYFKKAHEATPSHLGIRDMMNHSEGLVAAQSIVAIESQLEKIFEEDDRTYLENLFDNRPKKAQGDLDFME